MEFKELDLNKFSTLILPHVDQATCIECCKFYMVPTTALCGHTLCHGCWLGRKKCAICGTSVDRRSLKLNLPLQKMTEHIHTIKEEHEKIFKIKLDEFLLDTPVDVATEDPTKNVSEWLANSENQFSAPDVSQASSKNFDNQHLKIGCKVQIHSEKVKTNTSKIHVGVPQDEWDKIELLPETEDLHMTNKENAIGPMDIEPYSIDQFEFSSDNLRRSSRNKEIKGDTNIISVDKNSKKNSTIESDSKVTIKTQKWANVNRMKKEFSKLNKKSKNKLNVSIEMCKKTQYPKKNIPITNKCSDATSFTVKEIAPNIANPKPHVPLSMEKDKVSNNDPFIDVVDNAIPQKDLVSNIQTNKVTKDTSHNTNILKNHVYNVSETPCSQSDPIPPVSFIMKGALQTPSKVETLINKNNNNEHCITVDTDKVTNSTDDIEITIKIGNTLTKICIKKKEKDAQFNISADKEIQTSIDKCIPDSTKIVPCSSIKEVEPVMQRNDQNISQHVKDFQMTSPHILKVLSATKPTSSKKNTASAETATIQYQITESIEKELSKEMEKKDPQRTTKNNKNNPNQLISGDILDEHCSNDLDLFDNPLMKEVDVQSLKSSNQPPSEILMSTIKSRRQTEKRVRDTVSNDVPSSKKRKVVKGGNNESEEVCNLLLKSKKNIDDSESTNYDVVMSQVFANIDLDLENKTNEGNIKDSQFVKITKNKIGTPFNSKATPNLCDSIQGQSENVFSLLEKENENSDIENYENHHQDEQVPNEKAVSSLDIGQKDLLPAKSGFSEEMIEQALCTPAQNNDNDSDKSIVEETPQKTESFLKVKQKSVGSVQAENTLKNKSLKLKRTELVTVQDKPSNKQDNNVISLSDTTNDSGRNSKQATVIEAPKSRPTLETPLTISKFVGQIKHKSTPVAKKSLNFDSENVEISDVDPDQTLCRTSFLAARTTQEREFMSKAFEDSPHARAKSPLAMKTHSERTVKYCLAGSCLAPTEMSSVKLLCSTRNWDFSDIYTDEITHLVVGVDEDKKAQRSVKYMCALAASKFIVSYEWVQKCLQMKKVVNEEPYEALDTLGEPGPRRSRVAKQKLFTGITFYCMPPFSVLDIETLNRMLEAAGGRVVRAASAARAGGEPALLLAEPEHTQEDRFIYLAMELGIVPVNYEWALNCLGSYTLSSVQELLLCPASLLPPATARWPPALIDKEYE